MRLKYPIVAVDYDNTLTYGNDYPAQGDINMLAVHYLTAYRKMGGKLILFTCRTDDSLLTALSACKSVGLEFDAVNTDLDSTIEAWKCDNPYTSLSSKPCFDMLIDDKAYPHCIKGIDWVTLGDELLKCVD